MREIANNIIEINKTIPVGVKLVAVSKTKPNEAILEAYSVGQKIFGENKVQELIEKHTSLPKDIEWHLIGHLQSNKVKFIAPFVSLIHSVDSLKLLQTIDQEAKRNNRIISCLLQIKIASEESKFGLSDTACEELLSNPLIYEFNNIRINGLMGMATFTDNVAQIRKEFAYLTKFFTKLKAGLQKSNPYFTEISMGMSDDYLIAIEEGSTMIRVGSTIFGSRNYL